jgi:broad specificity phosphatase PhoE
LVKFILVRHGETAWNAERRIQGGGTDTPLSDYGRLQAEALGLRLKNEKVQAVYSSPLLRALDTAQAIARHHLLEVTPLAELKEINAGELEGISILELKVNLDEFICGADSQAAPLPGGESIYDVQKRSWETIQKIANLLPDGVVVIVSHYFVILTIVCRVLGLPLSNIIHMRLSTGSVTVFTLGGQFGTRLELFNDISHNRQRDTG